MGMIETLRAPVKAFRRSPLSLVGTLINTAERIVRGPSLYFSGIPDHPSNTAVIAVDMINGFLHPDAVLYMPNAAEIFSRANRIIYEARVKGLPVLYVNDNHSRADAEVMPQGYIPFHCAKYGWESQVHNNIAQPQRRAEVFMKDQFSAFSCTDILQTLKKLEIERLIILGVATEYCDESNAMDGLKNGFEVYVVNDAIRGIDLTPGDANRAVWRMVQAGIRFVDTVKALAMMNDRMDENPLNTHPTDFSIGPSLPENARPLVTEHTISNQTVWDETFNPRRDPFESHLTQTDFYQITMAYLFRQVCGGTTPIAHFEGFIRKLPADRDFMIFSGLQDSLSWMRNARFSPDRIDYIMSQPIIRDSVGNKDDFSQYLRDLRLRLEFWAQPEGSFFMPGTPYMGISGPLDHVLLSETISLALTNSRSGLSTRAAQFRLANPGLDLISMEMRRMDPRFSEVASWEAWKQGFVGTSNVEAGFQYGMNSVGTNSHAMYMAFGSEVEAIDAWMRVYPNNPMVLVDTFHTLINALKTIGVLNNRGMGSTSYRIDSGYMKLLMELYER
ncbi:MAG: isochorismatase family protein, partial [Candidatus Margulisiibacteriota bacterium]